MNLDILLLLLLLPGSWYHIRMESYTEQPEDDAAKLHPEGSAQELPLEASYWKHIRRPSAGIASAGQLLETHPEASCWKSPSSFA